MIDSFVNAIFVPESFDLDFRPGEWIQQLDYWGRPTQETRGLPTAFFAHPVPHSLVPIQVLRMRLLSLKA